MESVLLDLLRKLEPPGADEEVLEVPVDRDLEAWVAEQLLAR